MSRDFDRAQVQYENKMPDEPKCFYGFFEGDRVAVIKRNFSDFGFEGIVLGFDEGVLKVEIEGDDMKWVDWLLPQDLRKVE